MEDIPDKILETILKETSLDKKELSREIKTVMDKHAGLLKPESAAVLVAKRNGVTTEQLYGRKNLSLDIENLVPGMTDVQLIAYVSQVNDEFNPSDKEWRVRNVEIEDDTGKTTISFWNTHSDEAAKLREGHKIEVKNGYTKQELSDYQENQYGIPGVNISDSTKVVVYNNEGDSHVLLEPE